MGTFTQRGLTMKIHHTIAIIILIVCQRSYGTETKAQNTTLEPISRVILIDPWKSKVPAGTTTFFAQAKAFADNNVLFHTLLWAETYSEKLHKQFKLPHTVMPLSQNLYRILQNEIPLLIKKYSFDTVITPRWQDIKFLKKIAQKTPFKIVFLRIGTLEEDELINNMEILRDIDGFVSTPKIVDYVKTINNQNKLNIKRFAAIHPFWNEQRCASFSTTESRQEYFLRRFNINVTDYPVICTVANMENPCKNYPLLIQAIAHLVHQKKQNVHAMLAGAGKLRQSLEALAIELNVQDFVHFLGSINDIPALLHHSDFHVLPSYYENFPLANFEAAFMKKTSIIAEGLDASSFIKDQETGLLYKNRDLSDLTSKIEDLLNNPDKRTLLGNNAYEHLRNNYSNQILFNQWIAFLNKRS
jgi:glycosyltransferase involved in cell wall biosynthesis